MKNIIFIAIILFFLSSCYNDADFNSDSFFVVTNKEEATGGYKKEMWDLSLRYNGKYRYKIRVTGVEKNMIVYSDSDWEVGTNLKLTK